MHTRQLVLALAALPLCGQQFTFEVASIKPSNPTFERRNSSSIDTGGNGFRTTNTSLFQLITMALGAQGYQVSGGAGWIRDDRFDITAKNEGTEVINLPQTDRKGQEERAARVRSRVMDLLKTRFHLVLREEVKELPVYELTVDKAGPKLKAVTDPKGSTNSNSNNGTGTLRGEGVSMDGFSKSLASILGRPVINLTGQEGFYDVEIKYYLDNSGPGSEPAPDDIAGPSIFTALRETLGLRLAGKKGPVTTWVIEKAERPTEN